MAPGEAFLNFLIQGGFGVVFVATLGGIMMYYMRKRLTNLEFYIKGNHRFSVFNRLDNLSNDIDCIVSGRQSIALTNLHNRLADRVHNVEKKIESQSLNQIIDNSKVREQLQDIVLKEVAIKVQDDIMDKVVDKVFELISHSSKFDEKLCNIVKNGNLTFNSADTEVVVDGIAASDRFKTLVKTHVNSLYNQHKEV